MRGSCSKLGDAPDIGPVIAADMGELLLRHTRRLAQPPHVGGDDPQERPGFGLIRHGQGWTANADFASTD